MRKIKCTLNAVPCGLSPIAKDLNQPRREINPPSTPVLTTAIGILPSFSPNDDTVESDDEEAADNVENHGDTVSDGKQLNQNPSTQA